ncbi:MAG: hypothetical protein CSA11_04535 [Chloroflexi bacterium]|nr:MAG: hypothetical protein CSB13_09480 [Chloroflexota bacterium]PIE81607.1 MAG: hypothetical protein CSA11_04535 [Chloroflexota bacterium]
MNWKHFIPLILILIVFTACSSDMATSASQTLEQPMEKAEIVEDSDYGGAYAEAPAANDPIDAQAEIPQQRLIIRTADMSIVVADTEAAMKTIAQMVEENGGWVVSSSVYQYSDTAMTGDMTVRVPAEGFNSATEAVRGLALEVRSESTYGQDVTEEFVDLSSRLENLESTAVRVRSFLDESSTVEEALAVNQELSRLEEDIEVIKGRMKFLSQSAAFSTISIQLTPDEASLPVEVAGWRPEGVAKDAIESLLAFLQWIAGALIWIVIFLLPILLILGIPLWLLVRFLRNRRRRKEAREQ